MLVGPIATEELAPIVAGIEVAAGQLPLVPSFVVLVLGGWIATAILYAVGRWRGRWLRRRFPKIAPTLKRLLRYVRRRPWRSAFVVRFAFGLRLLLPLACGAAHVRPDVYLVASLLGSVAWTAVYGFVGWWFGQAALAALQRVREYNALVAVVVVGLVVVGWLIVRRRRANARQTGEASLPLPGQAPGPTPPAS
jgi:membrane protein DedA with SNARE-associated domain